MILNKFHDMFQTVISAVIKKLMGIHIYETNLTQVKMSFPIQYIKRPFGERTTENANYIPNPYTIFQNAELGDFCPRKLFEIVFANELTPKCYQLLDGIVEFHGANKKDSNIVFITRKSIINFVKEVVNNYGKNLKHPPHLLDHLQYVCRDLHDSLRRQEDISRKQLALIMKHKLINEMYTQYATHVQIDHDICQKEELLKKLLRLDYQKQIRFSEMEMEILTSDMKLRSTKCKKIDSVVELQMNDYTTYSLPDNLHGSDDLKDHVYFYVFVGFQDPCLLKFLMRYKVTVNCILQVASEKNVDNSDLTYFWKKINEISQNGSRFQILEEAAQLKFFHYGYIPDEDHQKQVFFESRLKELEEILMEILDLKRMHIHYIKHLVPFKFKDVNLNYGPYHTYEKCLRDIPFEFITIQYIIHSMLLEVEKVEGIEQDPVENLTAEKDRCFNPDTLQEIYIPKGKKKDDDKEVCPLSFNHLKNRRNIKINPKMNLFRKFYEGDTLNLKIYLTQNKKAQNVQLWDSKVLMNQKFFHLTKLYTYVETKDTFTHQLLHECIPRSPKLLLSQEQTNHFINLMYLNSINMVEKPSVTSEGHAIRNFCNPFDLLNDKNFLPKSEIIDSTYNWYSKFDSMVLKWKEPLSISILAQWLFEAQQEFLEVNVKHCNLTNTLIVHFHHDLESSGTRSRIWTESLRTLTCFRDFCCFYYLAENEWFTRCHPIKYISNEIYIKEEEKYSFEKLIQSNHNDKEYAKLLIPYYFCENFDLEEASCSLNMKNIKNSNSVMKPNLQDIISELRCYPHSKDLPRVCAGNVLASTDYLIAYDEKPVRFGLTGATHDFYSHDGINITVDTCKFLFEDFRLRVAIKFDGHSLIGHHKHEYLDAHMILKNGTLIKLILPSPKVFKDIDSCIDSEDLDFIKSFFDFKSKKPREDNTKLKISSKVEMPIFRSEMKHVVAVYNEDLEGINIDKTSASNRIEKIPHEKNINQDIKILKKMKNANIFLKYVNRNLKYTTRKYRFLEIPYSFLIRRILEKPLRQKCKSVYQKTKVHNKNSNKWSQSSQMESPHIKLCLSNGLTLQSFTWKDNEEAVFVKQTHTDESKYKSVNFENYRLFLDRGRVLIRYFNGNMKILDAQGTVLDTKHKQTNECDLKKCFKNIETCRRMIFRMFLSKNKICHDIHNPSRSRRGHLKCSKFLKMNINFLEAIHPLNSLFSSIKMKTFEGDAFKFKEQGIVKKKITKVVRSWDFPTRETLLTSTDGVSMLNNSNGNQIVTFPDGTKITKAIKEEKQLEFFTKMDQGWIVITHSYLYEHPYYCPVKFDNQTMQSTILLEQNNEIILSRRSVLISFADNCNLLVNLKNISIRKSCPECGTQCTCDITVNCKGHEDQSVQFLVCKDSYKKEFTSDFSGRCQINSDFIQGELNSENCNHVFKRDYHKTFLINEDLTGDLLWNDEMVSRELNQMKKLERIYPPKAKVEKFTDSSSDLVGISFTKNYYQSPEGSFPWFEYLKPLVYSRLEPNHRNEKDIKYQVCRKIIKIFREEDTTNILYSLVKKLLNDVKQK